MHKPLTRYLASNYILITDEGELESFQEVKTHKDKHEWMKTMQEKIHSLLKNDTYKLVLLPKGKRALGNKCVIKQKSDTTKLVMFKAHLVVKGFN